MARTGRPTKYTEELADIICERVATHLIGLNHICEMYEDMPRAATIREWRYKYVDFSIKYLNAKGLQAMNLVEEIDDLLNYEVSFIVDEKGNKRIDPPSASMAIARCNNRKWQAARLAPRNYGEKVSAKDDDKDDSLHEDILERKRLLDAEHKKEF